MKPFAFAALAATIFLAGCGGGTATSPTPVLPTDIAQISLKPYSDPWPLAKPRFLDIDDQAYSANFRRNFAYSNQSAVLTYQTKPANPYFTGHLRLQNLKPNFAYQLKLIGKPQKGSRGWKQFGDDTSNENIGFAGRWWDDTAQTNTFDAAYRNLYKNARNGNRHTIYGYLFMGDVVTDANGNADVDFAGNHSYHITWQDKQTYGLREVEAGTFSVGSSPQNYAYERDLAPKPIKLWYEWESGRSHDVRLPAGTYNCRFLITEESFHANFGGIYGTNPQGGFYQSVLVNEDFQAGAPDSNRDNDIRFTIQ